MNTIPVKRKRGRPPLDKTASGSNTPPVVATSVAAVTSVNDATSVVVNERLSVQPNVVASNVVTPMAVKVVLPLSNVAKNYTVKSMDSRCSFVVENCWQELSVKSSDTAGGSLHRVTAYLNGKLIWSYHTTEIISAVQVRSLDISSILINFF